jgi:hypothetical protein
MSLSNHRTWAEGLGPDAICINAEGAICLAIRAAQTG